MKFPPCPDCKAQPEFALDPRTGLSEVRAGDLAVCTQCGCMVEFTSPAEAIKLTRATARTIRSVDLALMYAAQAWARVKAGRPVP